MNPLNAPTVILGGGFVGLFTALHLSQQPYPYPIILIDRSHRFTFKPLLYELLTGELHPKQVCPQYRELLPQNRVTFREDTVESLNLSQRRVILTSGQEYSYGNLVLALGSQTTYFKIPGATDHCFPFTNAAEALTLKMRLHDCLETAYQIQDFQSRQAYLTVAIIGAGPAGVELACTLADILPLWYHEMGGQPQEIRVVLINRSDDILKGDINHRLRQTAKQSLANRTVKVDLVLNAAVTAITAMGVEYQQNGKTEFLRTMTVAWTGGTQSHSLLSTLAVKNRNQRGQLEVTPTLQLPNYPEVFVGGDCAYVSTHPQPPTAQVAYQQGKAIAHNLQALIKKQPLLPAQVTLRGTLMKLGIDEGVANLFDRLEIKAEAGHLIRHATYLELLPKPLHNFQITAEWLTDELFQRHQPRSINPKTEDQTPLLAGLTAIFASFILALPLIWHAAQPAQFQKQMKATGIPTFIEQLTPSAADSTNP